MHPAGARALGKDQSRLVKNLEETDYDHGLCSPQRFTSRVSPLRLFWVSLRLQGAVGQSCLSGAHPAVCPSRPAVYVCRSEHLLNIWAPGLRAGR